MDKTFYEKPKRIDKLTKFEREDLAFDLINAFAITKNSTDSAILLYNLLTKKEIQNLSKRLRIAKLLLKNQKQEDIVQRLHCSFATITKVRIWLDIGGEGIKKIIRKLPKRKEKPNYKRGYPSPDLSKILVYAFKEFGYSSQERKIGSFLEELEKKHLIDKQIKEIISQEFNTKHHQKKKRDLIKSISNVE